LGFAVPEAEGLAPVFEALTEALETKPDAELEGAVVAAADPDAEGDPVAEADPVAATEPVEAPATLEMPDT